MNQADHLLSDLIRENAHPLIGTRSDLDPLMEMIGDKPIVLLGEATHGTHEFYQQRFEITKRLIEEKQFVAVALEADWPDCVHINRHINSRHSDAQVMNALASFQRFPMWMWRNSDFLEMVEWLYVHNRKEKTQDDVSVYGIDLYSLYESMREVIRFLEKKDPPAALRARELYSCFESHLGEDPVGYGRNVRIGASPPCEEAVLEQLLHFIEKRGAAMGMAAPGLENHADELFYARQNAEVVKNAESYYRNLFSPLVNTWNVRDRHMADTVDNILAHLREQGRPEKIVLWAHNSHVGDDRATEMGQRGQWNIGQLLRERHPRQTFTVGFTTYTGTVQAASEWDHPPELKSVLPALPGSYEALFHDSGLDRFMLPLLEPRLAQALDEERLERAIGVIYAPETERVSHYFHARIASQFDAVIHFDRTREVEPLDRLVVPDLEEPSHIQF